MLSTKAKLIYALVLMLGCLNVASACMGYDTACYHNDPYSKFNKFSNCCQKICPDYPEQFFDSNGLYRFYKNA
ncbi:MAG TPA: hypothetical protein VLH77_00595 [Gammaproteobacteria bacterium]|nr:hypothetical protein [Gammaproteobacteria bacterium]